MTEQTAPTIRDELSKNISAFIAAIAEGITNGEATRAILVSVDEYFAAAIQSERASAARRVNEALEEAAHTAFLHDAAPYIVAAIRALKSPTPTGGDT